MADIIIGPDFIGNKTTFEKGKSRVMLACRDYSPSHSNPVMESKSMCYGTVIEITAADDNSAPLQYANYCVRVGWDNGSKNVYRTVDLLVHKGDLLGPNESFRLRQS